MSVKCTYCAAGALVICLFLTSCGYQFKNQKSKLPDNIRSIAVPIFKNDTNEVGLEDVLTTEIISVFNRRQTLKVKSTNTADSKLIGTIRSIYYSPVSFSSDERASERRVRLHVDVQLKESSTGKVIWSHAGLTYLETYPVIQTEPQRTEFNKNAALQQIAENLAEKLHDYLFIDF